MRPFLLLSVIFACTLVSLAQQKTKSSPDASTTYRNPTLGFRYQIPYGWVDRTSEMQPQDSADSSNSVVTKDPKKAAPAKGEVLLAVFERPPQAAGDTVNSAVVIATESASTYPGLKTAADYLAPLEEVTTAQGFKSSGDASDIEIDGHPLIRADFSRALADKLTMHQSTLVILERGRIVSFTFIAASEDEINDLLERLSFSPAKRTPH